MKNEMPEFRYLVEETDGFNYYTTEFETLEEANDFAWHAWNHLTREEKKTDSVKVYYVEKTKKYFDEDVLEGEEFEWSAWACADSPFGGFDSDRNI